MAKAAATIPEKIYFKIGEVCDIVGVQAHVLRYWETEFPMLSPQKNRSGQRSYRRKDVEISLRIKELLYDELFTIAGARKKLQGETRDTPKLKIVHPEPLRNNDSDDTNSHSLFDASTDSNIDDLELELDLSPVEPPVGVVITEQREAIKRLGAQLLELREMLNSKGDR